MLYRIPEFRSIAIEPVKGYFNKIDAAEKLQTAKSVNLGFSETSTEFECPIDDEKTQIGKTRKQKDAAEFLLNSILNKLDTHPFKHVLKSNMYCNGTLEAEPAAVGNPREKEYSSMLPLQLGKSTVQENIDEYFKIEILGKKSETCTGTSSKQPNLILGEGKYLLIQLARFKNNGGTLSKIKSSITINPTITVSGKQWALQGAVLHTGDLNGGHYRYLWKSPQQWILFNDSEVSNPATDVKTELNTNGYILLYKKIAVVIFRNNTTDNNGTRRNITMPPNVKRSNGHTRTRKRSRNNAKPPPANAKPPPANAKLPSAKPPNAKPPNAKLPPANKARKTQKKKYGFKSFIKSLLTPKDKAEYKKEIYTEDPLIKTLLLNQVVRR